MAKRIVVLSDGTWETVGYSQILEITEEAYELLQDGIYEIRDLKEGSDITDIKEVQ